MLTPDRELFRTWEFPPHPAAGKSGLSSVIKSGKGFQGARSSAGAGADSVRSAPAGNRARRYHRAQLTALKPDLDATVNGAAAAGGDNCCREASRVRVVHYMGT
ncbi:hypothetical protein FR943_25480 [Mycobacterium sp. TNTM28]|uniref:Uncharacterized protein n=1 Tax=[Mycobacterium] fortunisiensis TaxID=2600579 RepID=A0ABS6KUH6_9MYCO|nr:hypothetical protein [[Mycobacterium] fortunisiensis]MBU9767169.1 hypothetical protein [[Mycobacterium] fortunisiensis]